VSRNDLSQLERRLRAELAQLRTAASVPAQTDAAPVAAQASTGDDAIMRRIEERIAESEKGMRTEFTLRAVDLRRDLEASHRVDMASVLESFGQYQGATSTEIRQQREAINRLNNFVLVSQGR
jgi:sugar-specific transcriptional regulator TrmB